MKSLQRPVLLTALALLAAGPAVAQQQPAQPSGVLRAVLAPVIESIQVQADAALQPGSSLQFTVRGTPGGEAHVRLPGAAADVPLQETSRGTYTGSYTVRRADHIDASGSLRSSLTVGPATSVAHHWFPPSIRDSQALAAPVEPPAALAAQPLPPLGDPRSPSQAQATVPADAGTRAMGAPTSPTPSLTLEVLPPRAGAAANAQPVVVRGHTTPGAQLRVQVDAVPRAGGGTVVARPVMQETVRADAQGQFSLSIGPERGPQGPGYDLLLRVTDDSRGSPQQRLVRIPRG